MPPPHSPPPPSHPHISTLPCLHLPVLVSASLLCKSHFHLCPFLPPSLYRLPIPPFSLSLLSDPLSLPPFSLSLSQLPTPPSLRNPGAEQESRLRSPEAPEGRAGSGSRDPMDLLSGGLPAWCPNPQTRPGRLKRCCVQVPSGTPPASVSVHMAPTPQPWLSLCVGHPRNAYHEGTRILGPHQKVNCDPEKQGRGALQG